MSLNILAFVDKEKVKFKQHALAFMVGGFTLSLAFLGLFIGVHTVLPLNPLVFLFPGMWVGAFSFMIVRVLLWQ